MTLGESRGKALRLGHETHDEATASLSFRGAPKVADDPGNEGPGHEIDRVDTLYNGFRAHSLFRPPSESQFWLLLFWEKKYDI